MIEPFSIHDIHDTRIFFFFVFLFFFFFYERGRQKGRLILTFLPNDRFDGITGDRAFDVKLFPSDRRNRRHGPDIWQTCD